MYISFMYISFKNQVHVYTKWECEDLTHTIEYLSYETPFSNEKAYG